jgi:MoaA/NifB/PqqE/SkfB family radical SAM enzyme
MRQMLSEAVQPALFHPPTPTAGRLWQRYGNAEKQGNALRLAHLKAECAQRVDAFPWRVVLEPHNGCNLRCPECGAHEGELSKGSLSPDDAAQYLRELWPYLVQVNLFHWGEPLLNDRLPEIIALIHNHRVGTQVHSNLNHMPAGLAKRLIESGLDQIVISIDAVTQATYERFRRGGRLESAIANLRQLIETRRRLGSDTPRIEWKFVTFEHNLSELEAARQLAAEVGADAFITADGYLQGRRWTLGGPAALEDGPACVPACGDLWDLPVIHHDGSLLPCCIAASRRFVWGDLQRQTWTDAFNTEPFRQARRLAGGDGSARSACEDCFRIRRISCTSSRMPLSTHRR